MGHKRSKKSTNYVPPEKRTAFPGIMSKTSFVNSQLPGSIVPKNVSLTLDWKDQNPKIMDKIKRGTFDPKTDGRIYPSFDRNPETGGLVYRGLEEKLKTAELTSWKYREAVKMEGDV